jgi:hypothetical protein
MVINKILLYVGETMWGKTPEAPLTCVRCELRPRKGEPPSNSPNYMVLEELLLYPFITLLFISRPYYLKPTTVANQGRDINKSVIKGYVGETMWGKTPQAPLSVLDVGYVHVRGCLDGAKAPGAYIDTQK